MACDAQTLITNAIANGYQKLSARDLMEATVYSACAGSSNVTSGNFSGGTPNFTPSTATAIAIDTSNGHVNYWYSSAWH